MTTLGFTLFDSPIGRCGIAWGARGIVALQLPEANDARTESRMLRGLPDARRDAPPPEAHDAVDRILALLHGTPSDLSTIALDMDRVPAFHRAVYEAAREIPAGATVTYGELAARIGQPGGAQAVGQALGRNPFAIIVPCHRVLAAGRKPGGFSAMGGVRTKLRLLALEGVRLEQQPTLFDHVGVALGGAAGSVPQGGDLLTSLSKVSATSPLGGSQRRRVQPLATRS